MNDMSPHPASPPEMSSAEDLHPKERRSRRFAWIGMAASLLLFGTSIVVLWHIVSGIDVNELKSAFTAASLRQIGLAILFTTLSYSLLTCYDAIALRQLKLQIPYRTTALASFTSYAVSFTLGFPLLTAATVRYWVYAPRGVRPGRVASLTVIAGLTFWLGMGAVLAWSCIREAGPLAVLVYTNIKINQSIGVADSCAAAGVLYVLLPPGHGIGYETFLAVYVFAVMLGIASHAPGGLGVFEATILLALASLPREPVLGALLLFRLCYYLAPFILALTLLGAYEVKARMRSANEVLHPEDGPS